MGNFRYHGDGYISLVEYVSGGYSWSGFGIFRHGQTGQLAWATDSGCSCNGFGDGIGEYHPVASWQEALDRFPVDDYELGVGEKAELAEKLATHPADLKDLTETLSFWS